VESVPCCFPFGCGFASLGSSFILHPSSLIVHQNAGLIFGSILKLVAKGESAEAD
jgi:hypothetical protein